MFTCPRCGMVSHNPEDARQGYCGACPGWTRPRLAPGEQLLTPQALLSEPWAYEGTQDEGSTTVWRFDVLSRPWVSSWRPDTSLGAFTADWTHNELRVCVSTEVMARAVMERLPAGDPHHAWSWDELRQLYAMVRPPAALLYACRSCGTEFTVPPEHGEPVLCGSHSPPERMVPALRDGTGVPWSRPDADPLRDIQEARRLIEAAHSQPFDYGALLEQMAGDVTIEQAAEALGELTGASIDIHGELDQAAAEALLREIQPGQADSSRPTWIADAVEVWEGCKDAARRERSLAELAQDVADATPQIRPSERDADWDTAARWKPEDSGDVIL